MNIRVACHSLAPEQTTDTKTRARSKRLPAARYCAKESGPNLGPCFLGFGIPSSGIMPSTPSLQFECPNCAAKYEVVRVEAPPAPNTDREITCLSCGAPLHGREGPFLLKYFLRSKRRLANTKFALDLISGRAKRVFCQALLSKT